ncbi:unnamed protein product [Knipowitschia caucasica]
MSLVAPLVSLSVLCGLLAASSVNRTLAQPNTTTACIECSNGSASQNTSESGQRNVNSAQLDQQLRLDSLNNGSQDVLLNKTIDNGKQNLTQKINNTSSSSSSPFNISTQEPAKSSDLSAEPEASTGPHSDSVNNVPSNTAAGQANTGVITSPASSTTLSTPTTTTTTTTTTITTTTTTTTPFPTPTITVTHATNTTTSAPSFVTITPSSNTTTQMTKKPPATTATATTTTTTTATTTISASTATSLGFTNSPTVQYLSSLVEVAGQDLTSHLVDTASLLAILLFGLLFFFVIVTLFVTQAYESYRRKDYTQVDYLINGMYSDSGV